MPMEEHNSGKRKGRRQRYNKLPVVENSQQLKLGRKSDSVWIPPIAKDRHGNEIDDEATLVRDEKCQSQSQRHTAVLQSMDLIVDGEGFLIPRKCKKDVDDLTVDNELVLYDEEDEESASVSSSSSSSSSDDSSSDEEPTNPNEISLSSIPYCRLMPDSFDMGEAPETPSGNGNKSRNLKSFSTLETEAMTRSTSDSRSDISFMSPKLSQKPLQSHHHYHHHRPQSAPAPVPETCQVKDHSWDLISPLPDPSPSGRRRDKPKINGLAKNTVQNPTPVVVLDEDTSTDCRETSFFIPGITATPTATAMAMNHSLSSKGSLDSRVSDLTTITSTPTSTTSTQKKKIVNASPVISKSRISTISKKMVSPPFHSQRSPSQPTRLILQRHRSDSAADNHKPVMMQASLVRGLQRGQSESAKVDKDVQKRSTYNGTRQLNQNKDHHRHFIPENVEDLFLRSPNIIVRKESASSRNSKSPTKTVSSSSRGTSITTRGTLSNSTGRVTLDEAESHDEKELFDFVYDDDVRRYRQVSRKTMLASPNKTDSNHYFLPKSPLPSHWNDNQAIVDQVPAVNLDEDDDDDDGGDDADKACLDDEISEAGAVIVRTRKVFKSSSSSERKKSHRSSSRPRHRSQRGTNDHH